MATNMETKPTMKRSASDLDDIEMDSCDNAAKKPKLNGVSSSAENGEESKCEVDSAPENISAKTEANESAPKPTIVKIASVQRDAEVIVSLVPDFDMSAVYDKLATQRKNPNRLNAVATELLENPPVEKKPRTGDTGTSGEGETSKDKQNGEIPTDENNSSTSGSNEPIVKPSIVKIASVQRDAEVIASVVENVDVSTVYEKLASQRTNPHRLDAVTTDLLENPSENKKQKTEDTGSSNEKTKTTIYEDVKSVVRKVKQFAPSMKLNPAEIYVLLDRHSDAPNRTDVVADLFLEDVKNDGETAEVNLFEEVQKVLAEVPNASPDVVYTLLESTVHDGNRIQKVVAKLTKPEGKPALTKDDSLPNDPILRNDPVFLDMRKISKMFPEMDRNEIYAYIEAHHAKKDRVQVVIDEILRSTRGSLNSSLSVSSDAGGTTPGKPVFLGACGLQGEVDRLREIFPDCDPNYLFEELEKRANDAERVKNLAAQMFDTRNYPKLKDVVEKQEKMAKNKEMKNLKFDMQNFLSKFPNPVEYFYNTESNMSESYKDHCLAYVKNEFVWFKDGYLKKVLEKHNYHLAPTLSELLDVKSDLEDEHRGSKKLRQEARHKRSAFPDVPDERFYHELLFSKNEQKIKDHFHMMELERKRKVTTARRQGELYECGCCFDDEVLFEELSACADGHLFCRECIRRSTESALGEAKTKFPCLTGDCEYQIPLTVLQEVLTAGMFSKLLSRLQEEEIRLAEIPDLVSCPFCSFATVMSDPDDKVFKCLNPECLKETCRMCKEPNHVPLKCEEVEKQGETSMRTYIENRISEAMLRTCHRCSKRFFKDSGCNKMTCTCGATMCYVCREPDIDYDHFNDGSCNNTEDANQIHLQEMEKAAIEAKKQYLEDHPDADAQTLKYDPKKHVEEYRQNFGVAGSGIGGYDEYDEDDVRSDSDHDYEENSDDFYG